MKRILYIGSNLTEKSNYHSSYYVLSALLESEGFKVIRSSSKKNKILRLFDMMVSTLFKKYDVVLIDTFSSQNFYYALITSQIARLRRKPYLPILRGGNLPQRIDQNPKLAQYIFRYSMINVAPSGYLEYEFEARDYATVFIPNILNVEKFKYKQREQIKPKLLWVRAFAHFYNPNMAIHALHKLKNEYPNAELCMVGPKKDNSWEEAHTLVNALGLEQSVKFTGVMKREDWTKLSEDYDIFISTTTIDNTPVSVMEAVALGLPVLSTNVGGVPYLVSDEHEALLVDSGNVDAMVKAVKRLLTSPELVTRLTTNAKHKVDQFDWSVVRHQWLKLLGGI